MNIKLISRAILAGDEKFFAQERSLLSKQKGVPDSPTLCQYFSLISTDPDNRALLAVATLTAQYRLGEIKDVFVSPKHLRQGYASQLINHAEEQAREAGVLRLKATTMTFIASKVFEHCNYQEQCRIPLGIDLEQQGDFEGGPQYEILFLKELRP